MKSFTFTNKIQCTQEERNVFPSSGVWIIFTLRLWPHQSAFSPRKADIKAKSIRYPLSALLWTICNWGQHWQIDPLPPSPPHPWLPVELYPAAYWGSAITLGSHLNWSHSVIEIYPGIIFNNHHAAVAWRIFRFWDKQTLNAVISLFMIRVQKKQFVVFIQIKLLYDPKMQQQIICI